ncbi:3,4-dihydroxyphenylacetate 2,3-dioxygenase [Ralstonia mannitolilytica]|uniref:3,4-dihydroxyphenylacetate 2,3-dioxygenase n=1 Tax=Ralstonia mannitolilytica TaxID=105219 RepID=A0AAJ5D599_9RALS|nr:3,4-dihydroxyphenylacetate 2,3-dioxygenase [Ralstonia mannitolilytica]CAG2137877.1 3,4-dihydroxyphenylacetate 2,3-dioxygenase [Ralstonia mannitolilytica]CAJ0724794.1 3,4-dihydroxyphenylacetate 2,3-dioxygenase [Ralstonia mannitolilytica]SUD87505.1 3,4-dihydroxyphenylacetate 2,3-dioxygenase [Ralstonia mannitolilytica]SUD93424.1 3,4-dihydroxyphenylacetate 2,3-dioxygenase [Ralstonia mannitolilytica]SUD97164.1 3,4-dihydroxyphenylacetate 2,3-dioxygenase [Ralstonia mannitolilytica]
MGKLALAAKITHVPSMYLSELPGKHHGCRAAAIEGHRIIGQRCRDLDVDTIVVSDVHWLVNAGYHVNCNARFEGVYTSNELPHFIQDMRYAYPGNPALGRRIAETATARGVFTRAHEIDSLELEYGTLVPMRYMNGDQHFKVVSVAGWCAWHELDESRRFGAALLEAIEASDSTVAFLASGSLSHRFNDNGSPEGAIHQISREFYRQVDLRAVDLWKQGDWKTFCAMLPDYASLCEGEGGMHDTAMLLGLLGWDAYDRGVEIVTEYFASSGTGQINAIFPVPARS